MQNKSPNFSHYPLLWLAFCFAAGILTAKLFAFNWRISLACCLFFTILAVAFLRRKFVLVFLSMAFVAAGAFCFQSENQNVPPHRLKKIYDENRINSGDPVEIEGVLQSKPELTADGFFLTLRAEKAVYKGSTFDVSGNVRLFALLTSEQIAREYAGLSLQYGSRIRVACHLRREDNFLNPGVVSQKEILDHKKIDAAATVKSPFLIEKIGDESVFAPLAWIYERRQELIVDFKNNFSNSTAGILIASLLGNQHFLDRETAEVFRAGGTFHVLVISGLHITFIGGLTLFLLRFLTGKRFWQFVIAGAFLWAYSIAVGADVPVIRAAIMFTGLLFSQMIFRRGTLLNSLGACALILLVWRPEDLFNPSFQLTFASVAAIVAFAFPLIENLRAIGGWSPSAETPFPPDVPVWLKRFCETLYWREQAWEIENRGQIWSANLFKFPYLKWLEAECRREVLRYVFEALLVSLVVQIWLLPLLVVYFHRFSAASILLNLWVGIFIALESFAAVFALFSAQISEFLALPLIYLTEILNWFLLWLPRIFIANDWASIRVPVYSGVFEAIYLIYFVPVIILTIFLNNWRPFALSSKNKKQRAKIFIQISAIFLTLFFAAIVFHPFSEPAPDGRLHVDFLDVGQGDAALVTFPNGETLLVDGGGKGMKQDDEQQTEAFEPDTRTIGETVVSEFLWERGYSRIDYILATHADADHIQGLSDVAKNFHVRAAFFGRMPEDDRDFMELFGILQKSETELLKLSSGDVFTIGGVKIEVLHPERDIPPRPASDNNNSLVLRLDFGAKSFLLTGDIEKESEAKLLQIPEALKVDVVKVAHHGSQTSSTENFIKTTRAKYAVISAGRQSPFGHPHTEVVERWKNAGARILKTGEHGMISISTDGKDLIIKTYLE